VRGEGGKEWVGKSHFCRKGKNVAKGKERMSGKRKGLFPTRKRENAQALDIGKVWWKGGPLGRKGENRTEKWCFLEKSLIKNK